METQSRIARWPLALGLGILSAISMGNDTGGCVDPLPLDETACTVVAQCEGLPHVDCAGEWQCTSGQCVYRCGEAEDACATPADCEGLPHAACVGAWDCVQGTCAWECANEPLGCHSDENCPTGSHCSVSDGDCQTDPNCPMCDVCYGQCVPDQALQCIATGCSGEICAPEPVDSACIWLEWFACLETTSCGPLSDGTCGFAATEAFDACVQGIACDADADCPKGYECPVYRCGEDDPTVPPGERCIGVPSYCTPKAQPSGCTQDADCPPDQFCALTPQCPPCADGSFDCMGPCQLAGVCMPIEQPMQCQGDQDCPLGYHCEYQGGCPPCDCKPDDPNCACPMCMPPQYGQCVPDTHCCEDKDGDYFCVQVDCDDLDPTVNLLAPEVCDGRDNDCDGLVDEDCWQPERCTDDSQCKPGTYCRIEYCPECEGCPCYGTCQPIEGQGCATDADCPEGYRCEFPVWGSENGAFDCCPEGAACIPELPPCGRGVCVPAQQPGECLTDADCPDGYYCALTPWYGDDGQMACCPPNALCGPDIPPCGGGVCLPIENPEQCTSDSDCPEGYVCQWTGACPPCECDPATGECRCPDCIPVEYGVCVPGGCVDRDGDGACAGEDCDDLDPSVGPWMPEQCGDGLDNDCDGLVDEDCGTGRKCMSDRECYEGETCRFDGPYGPDGTMMCCLPGEMCLMYLPACVGECVLQPGRCWGDADCRPGQTCEGEIVCPPGAYCFAADRPGKCVDVVPPAKCASDADCLEGQVCRERAFCPDCVYADPACAMPCAVETVCVDICWTDAECPPGEYCDILRCGDQRCIGPYACTPYLPD